MALPKTFVGGERLFADDLNDNFNALESSIAAAASDATNASSLAFGTLDSARLPAGTIAQVKNLSTSTTVSTSANSFSDWTAMQLAITPTSASSKIFVVFHVPRLQSSGGPLDGYLNVLRNPGAVGISLARATNEANDRYDTLSVITVDSPATTDEVTYFAQIRRSGSGTANYLEGHIILAEILA